MSEKYFLSFIFLLILFTDCTMHRKIRYNIPPDIKGNKRVELLATLEKGRKLYEMNCSKCHGFFTKGKDGVPNFTDRQFDNYEAYSIKRDPRNHAVAAGLSPDQLHEIIMFLKDRKRKVPSARIIDTPKGIIDTLGK